MGRFSSAMSKGNMSVFVVLAAEKVHRDMLWGSRKVGIGADKQYKHSRHNRIFCPRDVLVITDRVSL